MREEIRQIQAQMEGAAYVTDPAISTAVHLATTLGKPLLVEGHAGVGKTEIAKVLARARRDEPDPAPVLRGPRRLDGPLRVELPEADPPHPPRGAGRAVTTFGARRPTSSRRRSC